MPVSHDVQPQADGLSFLGWDVLDLPMLLVLPVLLLLSGFFSGSETALFGLTATERMSLHSQRSFTGRAVEALLANQRMLLITILLGNMTVNVLYFVISSVLLMKADAGGPLGGFLLAAASLLVIVVIGEVVPKILANSRRIGFASLVAAPLLSVHRLIGPVRLPLDRLVVAPLSRLTSPSQAPPKLDAQELAALLEISSRQGVIDMDEQRLLQDVINLSRLKVRDVMTPRVRVAALPASAARADVVDLVRQTRLTKFPVYESDLDHIVGILHVKRYLMEPAGGTAIDQLVIPARFVPEIATLDRLLDHFRRTGSQLAIVVDEFGGTAGVVALEDVVEEIVGDIVSTMDQKTPPPRLIELGRWRVSGDLSVHEWAEAFGQRLVSPRVATLGGLIFERLGRAPQTGDAVDLGNVRVEVEQVDRARVVSAIVTMQPESPSNAESDR